MHKSFEYVLDPVDPGASFCDTGSPKQVIAPFQFYFSYRTLFSRPEHDCRVNENTTLMWLVPRHLQEKGEPSKNTTMMSAPCRDVPSGFEAFLSRFSQRLDEAPRLPHVELCQQQRRAIFKPVCNWDQNRRLGHVPSLKIVDARWRTKLGAVPLMALPG